MSVGLNHRFHFLIKAYVLCEDQTKSRAASRVQVHYITVATGAAVTIHEAFFVIAVDAGQPVTCNYNAG